MDRSRNYLWISIDTLDSSTQLDEKYEVFKLSTIRSHRLLEDMTSTKTKMTISYESKIYPLYWVNLFAAQLLSLSSLFFFDRFYVRCNHVKPVK